MPSNGLTKNITPVHESFPLYTFRDNVLDCTFVANEWFWSDNSTFDLFLVGIFAFHCSLSRYGQAVKLLCSWYQGNSCMVHISTPEFSLLQLSASGAAWLSNNYFFIYKRLIEQLAHIRFYGKYLCLEVSRWISRFTDIQLLVCYYKSIHSRTHPGLSFKAG